MKTKQIAAALLLLLTLTSCTTTQKPGTSDEKKATSHYNLGLSKFQEGDLGAARRELELAIRYAPDIPFYHNHLGLIYMAMNNYKNAEKEFDAAYKLDNTYSDALNNKGVLKLKQGKLQEAKKLFQRVLEDAIYPFPNNAETNLGIIAREEHRYDDAVHHFTRALHLKRNDCVARRELAKLYDAQKLTEKAAFNYTIALKYCPYDVEALYRSAVDFMVLKRENEGKRSLKTCKLIARDMDDISRIPYLEDCVRLANDYGIKADTTVKQKKEVQQTSQ